MKKGACCFASVSKGNILSPYWESNLRPLDSARDVLRLIHNELFGELGHHEVDMWIADKRTETLGPYEESNLDLRAGKMFRICSLWDRLIKWYAYFPVHSSATSRRFGRTREFKGTNSWVRQTSGSSGRTSGSKGWFTTVRSLRRNIIVLAMLFHTTSLNLGSKKPFFLAKYRFLCLFVFSSHLSKEKHEF